MSTVNPIFDPRGELFVFLRVTEALKGQSCESRVYKEPLRTYFIIQLGEVGGGKTFHNKNAQPWELGQGQVQDQYQAWSELQLVRVL